MSSKSANNLPHRWSLATWLTFWYSALAFVLIAGATAYSYWLLTSNLDREDDEFVAIRVKDVESRLRDEPTGLISLMNLWKEPSTVSSPLHIVIRVLKSDGTILAAMHGSDVVPWPLADFRGSLETDESAGEWRCLAQDAALASGDAIIIQAALDRRQESIFLARYRKQLYFVLFVAMLACSVGGILLARRGLRPLRELSSVAAGIGANQMQERLDPSNYAAELEQVALTFNGMLDRLHESFERLNRFSGDIAHELRTPLHNLQGEIEVALTRSRSESEYQDTLGSCLEETIRLSRLVESLLFLARSEQPQAALKCEPLHLAEELKTIQEFYEAVADEAGVQLTVTSLPDLVFKADRTLFQRVIGNLITNALAHTPRDGIVSIRGESGGDGIKVIVADTGVGIAADQLPQVFDRLYRGDGGRSATCGHGLGLSIVKSIVELHGGRAAVYSRPDHGTSVETYWPINASGGSDWSARIDR